MLLAMAQKQQVSGTVTNADGNPIVGATVVVDGTTTGTTTNAAGQFSLQARSDGYLNVSFIGYESQKVPLPVRRRSIFSSRRISRLSTTCSS